MQGGNAVSEQIRINTMPELQSSQKAYLKAMGIELWRERRSPAAEVFPANENTSAVKQAVSESGESAVEDKPTTRMPQATEAVTTPLVSTLSWQDLRTTVAACQQCELADGRTKTVFGTGSQQASLMLISDAPDDAEDRSGEPFTGESGQLLSAMLKAIGFNRNQVYITNITKCKTPGNREPSAVESEHCLPYLKRQIELLQPSLILALGLTAAQRLLNTPSTLNRLRGQLHYVENINSPVVVSYHPAYLLRAPNEKRKAWEDLKMIMQYPGLIKG
jgi:uracil-DNA glycosylase